MANVCVSLGIQALVFQSSIQQNLKYLLEEDDNIRSDSLNAVLQVLENILNDQTQLNELFKQLIDSSLAEVTNFYQLFWKSALQTLCRFVEECIFVDISNVLTSFMQKATSHLETVHGMKWDIKIPNSWLSQPFVSSVIPPSPSTQNDNEGFNLLFKVIFLQRGRLSHIHRMMAWHPEYLRRFHKASSMVLRVEESPLPLAWRQFLCIMACTEHKCSYLLEYHIKEFLEEDGDQEWLKGVENTPQKIKNISEFNALLAHQPWRINNHVMEGLLKGDAAWSPAEIMNAILILSTIHSLSSLVYALGILPEIDSVFVLQQSKRLCSPNMSRPDCQPIQKWNEIIRKTMLDVVNDENSVTPEDQANFFATVTASESGSEVESTDPSASEPESPTAVALFSLLSSLQTNGSQISYVDFDIKSPDYHVFRAQEWSWAENGYKTVQHILPETANAVDEEFRYILSMTDSKMNGIQTSTTAPFRQAIWHYTHRLYGILHDDYNYQLLNKLIPRKLKSFVKLVACQPEKIERSRVHDIDLDLQPYEIVHVVLLIIEARKQAELLYALRAMMKFKMLS